MTKKLKIKGGNVIRIYPNNFLVAVEKVYYDKDTAIWLQDYWRKKHNIKLPFSFAIASTNFPNSKKIYNYPVNPLCMTRPRIQFLAIRKFRKIAKAYQDKAWKKYNKLRGVKYDGI